MSLRYISLKCPECGRVWGRTEEYSQEEQFEEADEVKEYRYCQSCQSRKKRAVSISSRRGSTGQDQRES